MPVFRGIGDDDQTGLIAAIVGLVRRADRDVQEVTSLKSDCHAVKFVVDCAFKNEEELVAVGVQVARVGGARFEADVAEGQFGARG